MAASPSWLSNADAPASTAPGASNASWAQPGGGGGDEEAPSSASTWSNAAATSDTGTPTKAAAAAADDDSSSKGKKCLPILTYGLSLAFFAIFVVAAVVQRNDGLLWLIFYCVSAATVALFVMERMCFQTFSCLHKPLLVFGVIMIIWSCVLIGIAGKNLSDAKKSGNSDVKQDSAWEVTGASLALFSGLYHMSISLCCGTKKAE